MSFRLAIVSKVELWNFPNSLHLSKTLLMNFNENLFAGAIIFLVEFGALLQHRLELFEVRDDQFSHSILLR